MMQGLGASPSLDLAQALRGMIEASVIVGFDLVRPVEAI